MHGYPGKVHNKISRNKCIRHHVKLRLLSCENVYWSWRTSGCVERQGGANRHTESHVLIAGGLQEWKLLQNVRADCHLGKTPSWPLTSLLLLIWRGIHIECVMDFTGQMMSWILGVVKVSDDLITIFKKSSFRRHKINQVTKQSCWEGWSLMAVGVILDNPGLISAFWLHG